MKILIYKSINTFLFYILTNIYMIFYLQNLFYKNNYSFVFYIYCLFFYIYYSLFLILNLFYYIITQFTYIYIIDTLIDNQLNIFHLFNIIINFLMFNVQIYVVFYLIQYECSNEIIYDCKLKYLTLLMIILYFLNIFIYVFYNCKKLFHKNR